MSTERLRAALKAPVALSLPLGGTNHRGAWVRLRLGERVGALTLSHLGLAASVGRRAGGGSALSRAGVPFAFPLLVLRVHLDDGRGVQLGALLLATREVEREAAVHRGALVRLLAGHEDLSHPRLPGGCHHRHHRGGGEQCGDELLHLGQAADPAAGGPPPD